MNDPYLRLASIERRLTSIALPRRARGALALQGLLALAFLLVVYSIFLRSHSVVAPRATSDRLQRVIVIACDGLRKDRLSSLGYPRPTTPNLDKLLPLCATFTNAVACAPTTLASHMSLITGETTRSHFVRHEGNVLPDGCVTLAEALRSGGFTTAAFTDSAELSRAAGFAAGFGVFDDAIVPGNADVNGFARYGGAIRDFILRHRDERTFVYIDDRAACGPYHGDDSDIAALANSKPVLSAIAAKAHDPMVYLAALSFHDALRTERYSELSELVSAYDAAVHRLDRQIGELMRFLVERGLFDDTLIVIVSTHGESLFDRALYVGHGLTAFQEEVGVPVIVKFPKGKYAGVRCDRVVSLIDLYPTLTELAAVPTSTEVEGKSLLPILDGKEAGDRIAFGEAVNLAANGVDGVPGYTFYELHGAQKLIAPSRIGVQDLYTRHLNRDRATQKPLEAGDPLHIADRMQLGAMLFDLSKDPFESNPLPPDSVIATRTAAIEAFEELSARRRERLRNIRAADDLPAPTSEEDIEKRFLEGYLSSEQRDRMLEELRKKKK